MDNRRAKKLSDVILMMFYFFGPDKHFRIKMPAFLDFFYDASQNEKYRMLFKNFNWKDKGIFYGDDVIIVLENLEKNYLFSHDGVYWVKPSADFEKIKLLFNNSSLKRLRLLASEFLNKFKVE